MLSWLTPGRGPIIGAIVGTTTAVVALWLTGSADRAVPYTVLLVLAIAIVGLVLGASAAAWAWLSALIVVALGLVLTEAGSGWSSSEVIRLAAFMIGSPLIVLLVHRSDTARRTAAAALAESRTAQEEAAEERRQLELARLDVAAALASAERERSRLEEVAEAIPEPLVVFDDQLRGTYGNRAALRLFGRSFVERPLDEWGRATEPRDERGRRLVREEWPQILAQSEPVRRRYTIRVPVSGRDMLVDVEGTPIPGGGAVLMLRDVGKEEDERRRLSRFASFVAHELRNPLAVAKARTELAQRDPQLPDRARNHSGRALESVDAAIGILERLELYSRADTGRVEASREAFSVGKALGAAIERLRARGSEREVLVTLRSNVEAVGDRHLSEQAITNLLTNADRYSTPGAPIHLEVIDDDPVTLRVRDEGPGIADDVAELLFHDRVSVGRGLGLGLYLVRATMDAMGGSVQLEQRRPAAIFALRWPRADTDAGNRADVRAEAG